MGTIQIRIDEKTKQSAKKILESLGIDLSGAIKLFLKQVVIKKGIPFQVITENGFTPEEEERILKASKGKHYGPFKSANELMKFLNK